MGDLYWIGVLNNVHEICTLMAFLSPLAVIFPIAAASINEVQDKTRHYTAASIAGGVFVALLFVVAVTPDREMVDDLRKQVEASK